MDLVTPELLLSLAGGTASAAGQQIWTSLRDLVRRRPATGEPRGETELTALAMGREDLERARQLAEALAVRAQQDPAFAQALQEWRHQAEAVGSLHAATGDIHNEISGGEIHGSAVQSRDINGSLHFGR